MPTLLNGLDIPKLIYGTALKPTNPENLLLQALSSGFRAFDTAPTRKYHREDIDGEQLENAIIRSHLLERQEILVQTKFTPSTAHGDPKPFTETDDLFTQVLKSLEQSLSDLHVDSIDVYLLHCLMPTFKDTMKVWTAIEASVAVRKARYIGICNIDFPTLSRLYGLAKIKPSFVQNRYKRSGNFDMDVRRFCAENGILYEVFGVLGSRNADLLELPAVKLVASKQKSTPQEALLQLVWASGAAEGLELCILTGTARQERMRGDLELISNPQTIDAEVLREYVKAIERIAGGVN